MQTATALAEHAATESMFVPVPETILPDGSTVPAFLVSRYVCTRDENGTIGINAADKPAVGINYYEAREVCTALGGSLITERQWLAIAHNVAAQAANWTNGAVGEGLRNGNVYSAQPGNVEPLDKEERRWLTLSTGERLCDFNGNVWQWIFDDVQGDENGLTTIIKADSISLQAPFPSMEKGMGWRPDGERDWSGGALLRGGCWYSGSGAGVFGLSSGWPGNRGVDVGFRCTQPIGL